MNPEELEKILAENKKEDSVLKELFSAVGENDLGKVKSICEKNQSIVKGIINTTQIINGKRISLLECSADSEVAKYLIEQGADLNRAVTQAIQRKDLEAVKSICKTNKHIIRNALEEKSDPLKCATMDHCFDGEIVRYLIGQGADPNAVDGGCYLLHLQIAKGNLKGAKALIENGANVNIENQEEEGYWFSKTDGNAFKGDTSLHFAVRVYRSNKIIKPEKAEQALELIHFLIKKGANINAQNIHKRTPLYLAVFYNDQEVVKLLMEAGADVKRDNGKTVLDLAKEKNNQELITLLENGSQSIVNSATQQQGTKTSEKNDPQPEKQQPTNDSTKQLLDLSLREWAVIGIATVACALVLYFLAPLILGATVGIGTQLALGAVGAVLGSGVGYLTNVAIDKFCGNEVAEQIV